MGITAGPSFTTEQGFVASPVYLSISNYRFTILSAGTFQCVFNINAYKSREDKQYGRSPLNLPPSLQIAETFVNSMDFYRKSIYQMGYDATKNLWTQSGYTVSDVYEPGQVGGSQFTYDCSGFNIDGLNCAGFDVNGYDKYGFDKNGYNASGYDKDGYGLDGYSGSGFNREGFDKNGYTYDGYNNYGFDRNGYDREGYDKDGYNVNGIDRDGNPRPTPSS